MTTGAEIPALVSERLDGRYVRWREPGGPAFDGAERALDIHDAAAREHRALLRRLRDLLPRLADAVGGPVVFLFFTPQQSAHRRREQAS